MKRTAIIGLGGISTVHIASILSENIAEIAAICDIDEEKIKAAEKSISYPTQTFTDYREMLEKVKPDVVHICTPHFLHRDMAADSMLAGADVYLEKPAALNYAQGLEILSVQEQTGKKVCVSFQNRVIPTNLTAKQIIDSGEMGEFLGARGFMTWNRSGKYYSESPWRGRFATEGGGVLMNQSIHTLDLLYYFGGPVDHTLGSVALRKNSGLIEVEDTAEATIFYKSGKTSIFYATNCNYKDDSVQVDVYLEKGKLILRDNRLFKETSDGCEMLVDDSNSLSIGKMVWGRGHAMMMKRFYDSLDAGSDVESPYCTLKDGLEVLRVIGDIYATSPCKLRS